MQERYKTNMYIQRITVRLIFPIRIIDVLLAMSMYYIAYAETITDARYDN